MQVISTKEGRKLLDIVESKKRRCAIFIFYLLGLVFCIWVGTLNMRRYNNVNNMNEDFKGDLRTRTRLDGLSVSEEERDIFAYNSCLIPEFKVDPEVSLNEVARMLASVKEKCKTDVRQCDVGTQWTNLFLLNGVFLYGNSFAFVILVIGTFWYIPRFIGSLCNFCYSCCNCCLIVVVYLVFNSHVSQFCALNTANS